MPYAPHVRMSALGRLGALAGGERFSYSISLAPVEGNGFIPLGPNQAVWNDMAADLRAFHVGVATKISQRAVLEEVKFASIGADGKYVEDPVVVDIVDAPGGYTGMPEGAFIPPQSALVVSLNTDRRGRTGRGRFYLPMPGCDITPDTLQIGEGNRDGIQASAAAFLSNIMNAPGLDVLDLRVVVASTKGYNSTVTGVRVGKVLDTVRSRRRQLQETYDPATPVG